MSDRHLRWVLLVGGILSVMSCTLVDHARQQDQGEVVPTNQPATEPPLIATSATAATLPPATAPAPIYKGQDFSFAIPAGWTVHEGPSATGKNAWNYFDLGLHILVEVKGRDYLPKMTLTSREIPPGSSLRQVFDTTYAEIADQINQVSETEMLIDGRMAAIKQYNRPWGEPWYTFQDAWIEANGKIYMTSCQSKLNPEPGEVDGCTQVVASLDFP